MGNLTPPIFRTSCFLFSAFFSEYLSLMTNFSKKTSYSFPRSRRKKVVSLSAKHRRCFSIFRNIYTFYLPLIDATDIISEHYCVIVEMLNIFDIINHPGKPPELFQEILSLIRIFSRRYCITAPPSTWMACPVMFFASSEAR